VRDPSAVCAAVRVPDALLTAARTSFGTDEDLLLIQAPRPPPGSAG
jgi:hypothetical protein